MTESVNGRTHNKVVSVGRYDRLNKVKLEPAIHQSHNKKTQLTIFNEPGF